MAFRIPKGDRARRRFIRFAGFTLDIPYSVERLRFNSLAARRHALIIQFSNNKCCGVRLGARRLNYSGTLLPTLLRNQQYLVRTFLFRFFHTYFIYHINLLLNLCNRHFLKMIYFRPGILLYLPAAMLVQFHNGNINSKK